MRNAKTIETTTKKIRLQELRPPVEIRDNTKVRRQWVAGKIAEINAQPNREAKSIGGGSYQTVVVYELKQVQVEVQLRGTCQCCGNNQAFHEGSIMVITRHGYERPGDGYLRGMCPGAGHKAAEHDVTLTTNLIAGCKLTMKTLEQRMVKAGMTFAPGKYSSPGAAPRWQLTEAAERAPYFHPTSDFERRMGHKERVPTEEQKLRIQQQGMKRSWEANKEHAEFMERDILPRLGQDLYKRHK